MIKHLGLLFDLEDVSSQVFHNFLGDCNRPPVTFHRKGYFFHGGLGGWHKRHDGMQRCGVSAVVPKRRENIAGESAARMQDNPALPISASCQYPGSFRQSVISMADPDNI